jgi:hypothetical protein
LGLLPAQHFPTLVQAVIQVLATKPAHKPSAVGFPFHPAAIQQKINFNKNLLL